MTQKIYDVIEGTGNPQLIHNRPTVAVRAGRAARVITERGGRAQRLEAERTSLYKREYPDVWVATRKEIADWVREHPGDLPRRSLEEVLAEFPPPWPTNRREAESRG